MLISGNATPVNNNTTSNGRRAVTIMSEDQRKLYEQVGIKLFTKKRRSRQTESH